MSLSQGFAYFSHQHYEVLMVVLSSAYDIKGQQFFVIILGTSYQKVHILFLAIVRSWLNIQHHIEQSHRAAEAAMTVSFANFFYICTVCVTKELFSCLDACMGC